MSRPAGRGWGSGIALVAGDDQAPGNLLADALGQRLHQDGMALDRHHIADGEDQRLPIAEAEFRTNRRRISQTRR